MLILSRKVSETIVIDERVIVHVLGPPGVRVKIGIEAPSEVLVLRGELVRDGLRAVEPVCS